MTNKESKSVLNTFIEINGSIELPIVINAVKTAILALENQIPQKPDERNMVYYCPTCGEAVVITDFETDITMDFCIKCGQALDWSTESNE